MGRGGTRQRGDEERDEPWLRPKVDVTHNVKNLSSEVASALCAVRAVWGMRRPLELENADILADSWWNFNFEDVDKVKVMVRMSRSGRCYRQNTSSLASSHQRSSRCSSPSSPVAAKKRSWQLFRCQLHETLKPPKSMRALIRRPRPRPASLQQPLCGEDRDERRTDSIDTSSLATMSATLSVPEQFEKSVEIEAERVDDVADAPSTPTIHRPGLECASRPSVAVVAVPAEAVPVVAN